MNAHNMLSHGDTPMRQFGMPMSKSKDDLDQTQIHVDIEVKGQCHTKVMKMYDTSSHGDTLMCKI